jgi:hypothetical protein
MALACTLSCSITTTFSLLALRSFSQLIYVASPFYVVHLLLKLAQLLIQKQRA